MREYHVRICERLGVKFPGPTRHLQPPRAVPTDSSLSPGRRGRYHPRPPQTRTCAIHAFGSSRESFADDVMDAFGAILCHRHSLTEGIYLVSLGGQICDLPASTLAGLRVKARVLAWIQPASMACGPDNPQFYDQFVTSLIGDLIPEAL